MVPRKHLQNHRCMSMKHYIFRAVHFLIGADSFMTKAIIIQQWWLTKAHIFLCFNHSFGTTVKAGNSGGKCPLALSCTLHSKWDIWGSLPPPCFSVYIDWTEYWNIWHPAFQLFVTWSKLSHWLKCFGAMWQREEQKLKRFVCLRLFRVD